MRIFSRYHRSEGVLLVISLVCIFFLISCGSGNTTSVAPTASAASASAGCSIANPLPTSITVPSKVQTMISLPGNPFKSIATADGHWIFVSLNFLNTGATAGIGVFHRDGSTLRFIRLVPLTQFAAGLILIHHEQLLLVADQVGVTFVDVTKAESGAGDAVLGTVRDGTAQNGKGPGTIEVMVTKDEQYAFATDELQRTVSVIDVKQALTGGFQSDALVGHILVDIVPVGMALSPDGHLLYVTSEMSVDKQSPGSTQEPVGTLSVVDVQRAEHNPATSIRARVLAGCSPVRVVLSSSGNVAWVTARASNTVLAFDTARLLHDPTHALLTTSTVGNAPVGAILIDHDRVLVVANSNRFAKDQTPQAIILLDTQQMLAGHSAVLGMLRVGAFPREFDLSSDGQSLMLTNYNSKTLSIIDVGKLPKP